jgi:hypothetical protein
VLPEIAGGNEWELLVDTNLPDTAKKASFAPGDCYSVTSQSLLLFGMKPGRV